MHSPWDPLCDPAPRPLMGMLWPSRCCGKGTCQSPAILMASSESALVNLPIAAHHSPVSFTGSAGEAPAAICLGRDRRWGHLHAGGKGAGAQGSDAGRCKIHHDLAANPSHCAVHRDQTLEVGLEWTRREGRISCACRQCSTPCRFVGYGHYVGEELVLRAQPLKDGKSIMT